MLQGCDYQCSRDGTPPAGWIGPPIVRNTTEFPEWKGRDDWKKEEQESFHAHAYAEKRHKFSKQDTMKRLALPTMLATEIPQVRLPNSQAVTMLEQLAELIPSNYTQACDLAHRWVQQIGVAQFKKATGIIHMNCRVSRKGTLLSTEEYTTVLKTVRKTQLQLEKQRIMKTDKVDAEDQIRIEEQLI